MPVARIAVGSPQEEVYHPGAIKAAFAEFISTFIFVFAGQGSGVAYNKLTGSGPASPDGLIAAALAHAFALFVAVSVGANISGGHVNPAVTFGLFLGGNITLLRGLLYWVGQLLGSVLAVFLLKISTGGLDTGHFGLSGVNAWEALLMETVLTFGLVYTVYATAVDPKKGSLGTIPHCHRLHRRRQHPRRRRLQRGVDEPGGGVRTVGGELAVGQPVGVLGWPAHRRGHRRRRVRGGLRRAPHPRAAAHRGVLMGRRHGRTECKSLLALMEVHVCMRQFSLSPSSLHRFLTIDSCL